MKRDLSDPSATGESAAPDLEPYAGASARRTPPKLWTPMFAIIVLISFFLFVTGQAVNGGMAVYVECVGGTATFAGFLSLLFSIAAAIARFLLGPVIDTRGRIVVAAAGSAVLLFGIALAGLVQNDVALTIARFIQGAGFAAATTAAATAAADALPAARMGEGIGYFGLGQAVAMSIGPAIGLGVLADNPPESLFVVTGITAAGAFALCLACRYEKRPRLLPDEAVYRLRAEAKAGEPEGASDPEGGARPHGIAAFFEPHALPAAIPLFFLSSGVGFAICFVGLYGEYLGVANAGFFFTLSAITMILVRVTSKSFMDTALPITILAVTAASGVVAFALLLGAQADPLLLFASGPFYGVFLGLGSPVSQSVAVKSTPPERWGAANALVLLANDIGIGFSSLIWGFVNDSIGFSASIICVIVCVVVSFAVAWVVYPADAKRRGGTA